MIRRALDNSAVQWVLVVLVLAVTLFGFTA